MPRLLHLLLLLALLVALPALARPNSLPPPVVPQCIGVTIPFDGQPLADLDALARSGVGWVRVDFLWGRIEQTKGVYDFSAYDTLLAGLASRHIKPLFVLRADNTVYGATLTSTHEARAAFAMFTAAAAKRYRGRTILWELWKGPNGALAAATARAMRTADPNMTLIVPKSPGLPPDDLAAMFKPGLLKDVDAISVHSIAGSSPEMAADGDQALRLLVHRYAPPGQDVPLITLAGDDTMGGEADPQQAKLLVRHWLSDLADGVRVSFWGDWRVSDTGPNSVATQTLTHTLAGFRFLKRIPLSSPNDYLLLLGHGPSSRELVAWTTGQDHVLSLPVPGVTRISDLMGKAAPPILVHGRLRLILTASPVYVDVSLDAALRQAAAWTARPVDAIYTDGQPQRLTLTYHNPDGISHRIRFLILLMTPDGTRTPVAAGEDIVGPQQSLTLGTASETLSRLAVRARVGLVVDGVRQPYPQDVTFTPADPLALSVVALSPATARAQIANPGGTPFVGHLSAVSPHGVFTVPIRLASGQTALTVSVPCPAGAEWRLRDGKNRLVASLPARRGVSTPLTSLRPPPREQAGVLQVCPRRGIIVSLLG